jgi:uncharacterized protein (TIGR02246 family)
MRPTLPAGTDADQPCEDRSVSDEDVRALLDSIQQAASARDLDGLASLFADDPVLFGTASEAFGRDAVRAYLSAVLEQERTIAWSWDQVVVLERSENSLSFVVKGGVGWSGDEPDSFRLTCLAVRDAAAPWRLRHFHGSVPDLS